MNNYKMLFIVSSLFITPTISCMSIFQAVLYGNTARVKELVLSDPRLVNVVEKEAKMSPLHYATTNNREEIAKFLLKRGAKVNAQDDCGETPLHRAAQIHSLPIVRLLLEWNAKIDIKNEKGETPSQVALDCPFSIYSQTGDNDGNFVTGPSVQAQFNEDLLARGKKVCEFVQDWPYYKQYRIRQLCAFCMGQHQRLGQDSAVNVLPHELYPYIGNFVKKDWKKQTVEQIHEMAGLQKKYIKNMIIIMKIVSKIAEQKANFENSKK